MSEDFEWTDEKIEELTKLWATGLTAAEIGRKMGVTKNAVVSKVRRLDLAMRRQPKKEPNKGPPPITLLDLKNNMCAWPEGEPGKPDFRFCGKPIEQGKPYCAAHDEDAHAPR